MKCRNCEIEVEEHWSRHCSPCERQYQKECREQEEFDKQMEEGAERLFCRSFVCFNKKFAGSEHCFSCNVKKLFN